MGTCHVYRCLRIIKIFNFQFGLTLPNYWLGKSFCYFSFSIILHIQSEKFILIATDFLLEHFSFWDMSVKKNALEVYLQLGVQDLLGSSSPFRGHALPWSVLGLHVCSPEGGHRHSQGSAGLHVSKQRPSVSHCPCSLECISVSC